MIFFNCPIKSDWHCEHDIKVWKFKDKSLCYMKVIYCIIIRINLIFFNKTKYINENYLFLKAHFLYKWHIKNFLSLDTFLKKVKYRFLDCLYSFQNFPYINVKSCYVALQNWLQKCVITKCQLSSKTFRSVKLFTIQSVLLKWKIENSSTWKGWFYVGDWV